MRWRLIRRRLSVSAPRMIVRSHLPWPLRWAVVALMVGFSAALALWAFEVGKGLAGLPQNAAAQREELARLRAEVDRLGRERDAGQGLAHAADSLIKAERAAQERLAQQVRTLEAENADLRADLAFFERLLPTGNAEGVAVRALQASVAGPGQLRYQLLIMQPGRAPAEFHGRYELLLSGTLEGRPWSLPAAGGPRPLQFRQYQRAEGLIEVPPRAQVRQVQVRVLDSSGALRTTQVARL
ncbi:MAG: hypothetical protein HZB72_14430 [Burkholderiales bacterium]|nr:hypothetical protein [Burkholderiales bacterium]